MAKKVGGVKGYISTKKEDKYFSERYKGEMIDKEIKWPRELGAEHPFKFEDAEKLYKKSGLINGIINKIANSIVGEFTVNAKNPNVLKKVTDFIKRNNFPVVLREWIREGLLKGNGFMEVDIDEGKVRVLNANNIYVKRNKYGDVLAYNQYVGDVSKFNTRKVITLKPSQIAHLKINPISDEAYGLGITWPNERTIENIILDEQDKRKLTQRKAGAPMHVRIGLPGEVANTQAIDSFKTDLQYMNNRTEWVTDGNVEMKIIDFGDIGKNITESLMYNFRMLIAGMDVPEVLLNSGQLNEGIAKVQLEGWQRGITSYQDMIEGVIVENIINPYLEGQGLKGEVDFIWNIPGEAEVNARLEKLTQIMNTYTLSENMRRIVELEIARLLNIQDAEKFLQKPEQGAIEKKAEAEMPQPEVPGAKPNATQSLKEKNVLKDFSLMTIKEFINVKETKDFNYSDYLLSILKRVKVDKFEQLQAITEQDYSDGLLNESEIGKLRTILKEGFKKNMTMREIETNIREGIQLKDRITENGSVIPATNRPEMIARTETIRLSNEGLMDLYRENKVEKKQWVSAWSDRTCENCMQLDGQIKGINETFKSPLGDVVAPALHPMCRCTLIAVI